MKDQSVKLVQEFLFQAVNAYSVDEMPEFEGEDAEELKKCWLDLFRLGELNWKRRRRNAV